MTEKVLDMAEEMERDLKVLRSLIGELEDKLLHLMIAVME